MQQQRSQLQALLQHPNHQTETTTRITRTALNKCKLVKEEVLRGMTVLCLVLPTTEDKYYMDMPNATTAQALKTIIKIVGKQEWMEEWSPDDNLCIPLSNIRKIKTKMFESYFQQGTETVGAITKEIWQLTIAGTTNKGNNQQQTVANNAQPYLLPWMVIRCSPGSFFNKATWADPFLEKIKPKVIKVEEDEAGGNLELMFDIQTVRYSATTNT
jgi:hypothetical protein